MTVEQNRDTEIVQLKMKLKHGQPNKTEQEKFIEVDNVLHYISNVDDEPSLRLYVPSHMTHLVIRQYHDDNGHPGCQRLFHTIKQKYYWPNMFKELHQYVNQCVMCQTRNLTAIRSPTSPEVVVPPYPFSVMSIDVCGPYARTLSGNRYIICFADIYTGYIEAFASPDKSSDSIVHLLLNEMYSRYSCPLRIITDNGSEFTSAAFTETLKELNIDHVKTTTYHPAANGMNERSHATINNILSKTVQNNVQQWDVHLNLTLAAMRFSTSETSKTSPYFLLFNRDPVLPIDNLLQPRRKYQGEMYHKIMLEEQHKSFLRVRSQLKKSKRKRAEVANKKAKDVKFEINDPVYYKNFQRNNKLDIKWKPYYRIIEQKSPLTYIIKNQLDNSTVKVHAEQIRLANIENWPTPTNDNAKALRRANLAYAQSDSSSSDSDTPPVPQSDCEIKVPPVTKNVRKIRDNSDDEDDIPLAELQKHLRNKRQSNKRLPDKLKYSSGSNSDNAPSDENKSHIEASTVSAKSSDNEMIVDSIKTVNTRQKSRTDRDQSVKDALARCMSVLLKDHFSH